jgi:hypothetical protein
MNDESISFPNILVVKVNLVIPDRRKIRGKEREGERKRKYVGRERKIEKILIIVSLWITNDRQAILTHSIP